MTITISTDSKNRFPWRKGNRYELLLDGHHFFPEILSALKSATHFIIIELYLVKSGEVANRFISALLQAAQRDVQIFLLLDDYGTQGLKEDDRNRLRHQQIQIIYYNPLGSHSTLRNLYKILWRKTGYDLHRDHRKLILIDGAVAFVGGLGLTDEFDPLHKPERCWRENVVKIEGPVITDWYCLFKQSWDQYATTPLSLPMPHPPVLQCGGFARVAYSQGRGANKIKRELLKRTTHAEHRIWLCTAYFLPSWRFRQKLRRAARKGIDVRLLLPGPHTDHTSVRHAGRRHYYRLLRSGVQIFEYQPRVLHAKTLVCDNWISLGSNNFDQWGLTWNQEANLEVEDQVFTETIEQMFTQDFAQSREITLAEWHQRTWYQRLAEQTWGKVDQWVNKITNRIRRYR